jgi:hypothetical protein
LGSFTQGRFLIRKCDYHKNDGYYHIFTTNGKLEKREKREKEVHTISAMMDIQPRSPPFFYAKSVDFQGFFDILSKKTSGLSNAQAAAGMVEVTGFEPATFWSRTKRATKLRYTSTKMEPIMGLEPMTC